MSNAINKQEPPHSIIGGLIIFLYGVLTYGLGVASLLFVIGMMLGIIPFTGGPVGELDFGSAIALDAALLLLFGVQHTIMARRSFKERLTRIIPVGAERPTYMLATAVVLGLMAWLWQPMPTVIWSVSDPNIYWALIGVALFGWVYLFAASFAINHFELFGLQQSYQALRGKPITKPAFTERWMYRFDRHPIQTGVLIGIWATPTMALDHLLFSIGTTLYVCIGVYFEERALRKDLGQTYEDYRKRVGTTVPSVMRRS